MTKQEYLAELRAALSDLSAEEDSRACAFYEEMIDDRMEAGEDERDAVAAMEPPAVAASRIVDEMPAVPRALARAARLHLRGRRRPRRRVARPRREEPLHHGLGHCRGTRHLRPDRPSLR